LEIPSSEKTTMVTDAPIFIPRTNVLGVGISAINLPLAVKMVAEWVELKKPGHYVCVRDMHGVMKCQKDEDLRHIHNRADLVTPDGMPMVWLSRLAGNRNVSRVYGPDLMLAVSEISTRYGYRQFYYGGSEGVAELLSQHLQARYSGLQVAGAFSPPFRAMTAEEDSALVEKINTDHPDILWVGLSTPKQEYWMAEHAPRLNVPVLIGVGAAYDFHAGVKKQAPTWMRNNGIEWLFRLITEPVRLGKRYLTNIPAFIFLVVLQLIGLKKFPDVCDDHTKK
jgi:N-acetylglucosaminyldiphosphoundecaprenol N-acetyl-beta-D-mannosaminyltransferase